MPLCERSCKSDPTGKKQNGSTPASAYTRFYTHDAWGNISYFSSTTFSYATNASGASATNRIATATNDQGTVGLSYDAAGNLTQDGSAVYNYDAANRLKESASRTPTATTETGYTSAVI